MNQELRRRLVGIGIVALATVLVLAACGGNDEDGPGADTTGIGSGADTTTAGSGTDTTAGGDDLIAAAEEEGALMWYTPMPTEAADALITAFREQYPSISAEYVRDASLPLSERFLTEAQAGVHTADVFTGAERGVLSDLVDQELAAQYVPAAAANLPDQFVDPNGYWWSQRILVLSIMYNTDTVPEDQAPETWMDLTDPYWSGGKLGVQDPRQAVAAFNGYWAMYNSEDIGTEFFEALGAVGPTQYAQGGQLVNALSTGEIQAAVTNDNNGWNLVNSGAPIQVVYPAEGVGWSADYTVVVAEAPHPNAARLFVDFLATDEAMDLLAETSFNYVSNPEIAPYPLDSGRPLLSDLNLLPYDAGEAESHHQEFGEQWATWMGE